jgi:hypothetical protein
MTQTKMKIKERKDFIPKLLLYCTILLSTLQAPPRSRPVVVAVLGPSLFQLRYVWSPNFLGLIKCVAVKRTPRTMQIPPTTT